jgi:hypothetical protein
MPRHALAHDDTHLPRTWPCYVRSRPGSMGRPIQVQDHRREGTVAMPRILLLPNRSLRAATSPSGSHHDLEDQAVLDFLRGDYTPAAPNRPRQTDRRTAPPVVDAFAYCADARPAMPSSNTTLQVASTGSSPPSATRSAPSSTPSTATCRDTTLCLPPRSYAQGRNPKLRRPTLDPTADHRPVQVRRERVGADGRRAHRHAAGR